MSDLNEVGAADNWRCWLCDKPVDPDMSVNNDLGPSVDSYGAVRVKKGADFVERLAHRQCNTMKGKISPVVPWRDDLLVVDPSPIFETVERLRKKGGREIIVRCLDQAGAEETSEWLLDRLGRLAPEMSFETQISSGAGQFMITLRLA